MDVDAECIQCSFPAVRNPVPSKCATAEPAIRSRITAITLPVTRAAIRVVQATRVAAAMTTPNGSDKAATVRDLDRNCPWNRYTPIPARRGPYRTGAPTPAGASALVTDPQEQAREIS